METQPIISVGIMAEQEIRFTLSGKFIFGEELITPGNYIAKYSPDGICIIKDEHQLFCLPAVEFIPFNKSSLFELKNVKIGINFHWEQNEDQQFRGSLKFIQEHENVRAINLIPVEEYLKSVISSEMRATSSRQLLKAHSVISRSWLLAQIEKKKNTIPRDKQHQSNYVSDDKIIRWYGREDHDFFDVCSDDHCQRYQGITKIISETVLAAVEETFGEVIVAGGQICDARYSKCCGGMTECFENVWEPEHHSYLVKIPDHSNTPKGYEDDLTIEANAEKWIRNSPPAFCNTDDKVVLAQLLPGFDLQTTDFYRWKVEYTQEQLSGIIRKKSGIDFGEIIKFAPFKRGTSGRIINLKIIGTKKTLTVGNELEIRKWLSESHLYSSAIVFDYLGIKNGIPQKFVLTGAGWGHGVGLCQIGAAMIGEKGYDYKQILAHYFKGAGLKKLYPR
jgi:stage II sporulation protein D